MHVAPGECSDNPYPNWALQITNQRALPCPESSLYVICCVFPAVSLSLCVLVCVFNAACCWAAGVVAVLSASARRDIKQAPRSQLTSHSGVATPRRVSVATIALEGGVLE